MLREDPRTTIEQALDISKRNDIMKELPFLNRILIMAKNMDDLDDDQRFKITQDLRIMRHIESLKNASLLKKDICGALPKKMYKIDISEMTLEYFLKTCAYLKNNLVLKMPNLQYLNVSMDSPQNVPRIYPQ